MVSSASKASPSARLGQWDAPFRAAYFLAPVLFWFLVLRLAWVSDDGFIAERSWDNLVHGHGLVLNWGQRVQGFTSALHTLVGVPAFFLTRRPFAALILTSLAGITALTWLVLQRFRGEPQKVGLFFVVLALSSSILTYATAGLENALGYFVVTGFVFSRLGKSTHLVHSYLWAGAVVLCRHDLTLLVIPTLIFDLIRQPKRAVKAGLIGFVPPALWTLFSLFYFGFPFPNTAYAKLNIEIPRTSILNQGVAYFADILHRDLPLALLLLVGIVATFRKEVGRDARLLLGGVTLYLAYVLWIGGDFMGGRFFTVPGVMICAVLVASIRLDSLASKVAFSVLAFLLTPSLGPFKSYEPGVWCGFAANGITDERACYAESNALSENITKEKWKTHTYLHQFKKAVKRHKDRVIPFHLVGMAPYGADPGKHILETWSLTEPLLARLTFVGKDFRPGHFPRAVPQGYEASLRTGKNQIKDPCIHRLYDRLRLATQAPLFESGRLQAILQLNFGGGTCPTEAPH